MVATAERDATSQREDGEHGAEQPAGGGHAHELPERDSLAHTKPLIAIWLPMLIVVGLIIVTGFTTSDWALAGAVVALVITTYVVVAGTIRLASVPPEDGEDDEDRGSGETQ